MDNFSVSNLTLWVQGRYKQYYYTLWLELPCASDCLVGRSFCLSSAGISHLMSWTVVSTRDTHGPCFSCEWTFLRMNGLRERFLYKTLCNATSSINLLLNCTGRIHRRLQWHYQQCAVLTAFSSFSEPQVLLDFEDMAIHLRWLFSRVCTKQSKI